MMGGGDLTDWALEMETKRKKVKNYDIQVVTAWGRLVKLDGSTQITNLAGLVCGLYSKAKVQESIGKTRTEAGFGIPKTKLLELLPAEMDNSIIVQQEEPFLPGLPDDLVLDTDVLGVAEVAPVRAHHLRMVDIEVVEPVVFPIGNSL